MLPTVPQKDDIPEFDPLEIAELAAGKELHLTPEAGIAAMDNQIRLLKQEQAQCFAAAEKFPDVDYTAELDATRQKIARCLKRRREFELLRDGKN